MFPPDSEEQQAALLRVAEQDAYNWGCAAPHPQPSCLDTAPGPERIHIPEPLDDPAASQQQM